MIAERLEKIRQEIEKTKGEIQTLNELRPGTLVNFSINKNNKSHGPYSMVVYSENGKKRSRHVHVEYQEKIQDQISNYKKLKSLIDNWIVLGIEYSQLEMQLNTKQGKKMNKQIETINDERRVQLRKDKKYIHIMKYMGSKRALLPDIYNHVKKMIKPGDTVLDIFAGTCGVGSYLKHEYTIISNDIQNYSKTIANALIASSNLNHKPNLERLLIMISNHYQDNLNELETMFKNTLKKSNKFVGIKKDHWGEELRKEYVDFVDSFPSPSNKFSTKNRELKKMYEEYISRGEQGSTKFPYLQTCFLFSETYFSLRQCMQIDSVRYAIDKVFEDEIEKDMFLSALLYAHSYCSSGTGHFAMFRDLVSVSSVRDVFLYRGRNVWDYFQSKIEEIINYNDFAKNTSHQAVSYDYKELLENENIMKKVNLVYADPPYSFVHYSRFYHATESLVKYDYGIPEFKGRYRTDRHQSPFCQQQNVEAAFCTLIERCAETKTHLLISYADTGMIALQKIMELLRNNTFNVELSEINYDHSTMGRSGHKNNQIKEYLISATLKKARLFQ